MTVTDRCCFRSLILPAVCGLLVLAGTGIGSWRMVAAAEPLPFLMADDFRDMELVAWRIEQGRPDPANPLLEPEMPWDAGGVFSHGTVLKDPIDGRFKAWQVSTPLSKRLGPGTWHHDRWLTYLESDDGVRWHRPKLGLIPWKGHPKTNLIMELWCAYASVNIDPKRAFPYEMFVFRYPGYPGASGRVKGLALPKGVCIASGRRMASAGNRRSDQSSSTRPTVVSSIARPMGPTCRFTRPSCRHFRGE